MLKNSNRFASNGVYHAMKKTGFVGAGVNGRHRVDLAEFEKRKKKPEKKGKKLFEDEAELPADAELQAEPDADEFDPTHEDGDCDDPKVHLKKIAKHAKTLRKVAVDIGSRINEMHAMGLE